MISNFRLFSFGNYSEKNIWKNEEKETGTFTNKSTVGLTVNILTFFPKVYAVLWQDISISLPIELLIFFVRQKS